MPNSRRVTALLLFVSIAALAPHGVDAQPLRQQAANELVQAATTQREIERSLAEILSRQQQMLSDGAVLAGLEPLIRDEEESGRVSSRSSRSRWR